MDELPDARKGATLLPKTGVKNAINIVRIANCEEWKTAFRNNSDWGRGTSRYRSRSWRRDVENDCKAGGEEGNDLGPAREQVSLEEGYSYSEEDDLGGEGYHQGPQGRGRRGHKHFRVVTPLVLLERGGAMCWHAGVWSGRRP